jgi:hypothetical protein
MKYYIQRDLNQYGPYTLADLQRYVVQGNILMTDLTKSEGMNDWVPVSQVIGNIPIAATAPAYAAPGGTVYGGAGTIYGGAYAGAAAPAVAGPVPPDLHWALVLLIGFFTCGLFLSAWLIVEAAWVRKIKPSSAAIFFVCTGVAMSFISGFMGGIRNLDSNPMGGLLWIVGVVLNLIGIFQIRSDLEDYYNFQENISLNLNGGMTFFFAVFYFQHHFSRIAKWKKTGVLDPQG